MKPIKAGDLRHRVTIQQETNTPDSRGGNAVSWAAITNGTCWASVEPMKAYERFQHAQIQHAVTHKVTVRHRTDITAGMRVLFGSRTFEIQGIRRPDERNRYLILECEEKPA